MDITSLYDVSGKVALVTGGGSGIGTMATEALVRAGVKVYIASRKITNCEAVANELNPLGPGSVIPLAADLSTGKGAQALVDAISADEDKIDILVNNSGTTWGAPLDEFPREKWDQVLALNVTAVADLTRLMLPLLRASGNADDPARIVNIGSIVGTRPIANLAYSYGASKAAVHHVTKMFSHELAGENITVNAIAPGPFPSRMMAFVTENEKLRAAAEENVPLGRLGRPEDIAGVLLMLVSKAGSYITGGIIPLDGGGSAKP